MKTATLVFPVDPTGQVLLGLKRKGFGAGMFNGFGGKVKEGERVSDAAVRELSEETQIPLADLTSRRLRLVGRLTFDWPEKPENGMTVYVFFYLVDNVRRFPAKESDEMVPVDFPVNDLPYSKMWEDDRYWLKALVEMAKKTPLAYSFQGEPPQVLGTFVYTGKGKLDVFSMSVGRAMVADPD